MHGRPTTTSSRCPTVVFLTRVVVNAHTVNHARVVGGDLLMLLLLLLLLLHVDVLSLVEILLVLVVVLVEESIVVDRGGVVMVDQ